MAKSEKSRRIKRVFRKRRRQVEGITTEANKQLDRHVFRRITNLQYSWRFIMSWLIMATIIATGLVVQVRYLDNYYLFNRPVSGGEFVEGIQGTFNNVNPIYAVSAVDSAVSKLVFSGLLKYDNNGNLTGDLAEKWSIDENRTIYTFNLRNNAFWHDGQEVTAEDVIFTIRTIQNPDTLSPYNLSWQDVAVRAVDKKTVQMVLPGPLTSFAYSLTQGIVPKHILEKVPSAQLRSSEFNNRSPVGSGPFVWGGFATLSNSDDALRQRISLVSNPSYHFGATKLDRYSIEVFGSEDEIVKSLDSRKINGATLTYTPKEFSKSVKTYNIPTLNGVYIFFHNQKAPFNDKQVRNAASQIIDTKNLLSQLDYVPISVNSPILRSSSAYDATKVQRPYDIAKAIEILDKAGWVKPPSSFVRQKDSKPLEFTLLTENQPEYVKMVDALQKQFADVGIKMNVDIKEGKEFQRALLAHDYEALLYGIAIGKDPDVFVYWHSSQATTDRFNFSEYKSGTADSALEGGRTRADDELRKAKYRPFLDAWREDSPAVGLYQPRLLFALNDKIYNFVEFPLALSSDRYSNIHEWMINVEKSPN